MLLLQFFEISQHFPPPKLFFLSFVSGSCLRKGGNYKILFFVTEQRGRVVQQDAATIRLVHEAAPEIKTNYGIIVNMISKKVLMRLNTDHEGYRDFLNTLFAGIPEENKV